jgi:hypothetical protein
MPELTPSIPERAAPPPTPAPSSRISRPRRCQTWGCSAPSTRSARRARVSTEFAAPRRLAAAARPAPFRARWARAHLCPSSRRIHGAPASARWPATAPATAPGPMAIPARRPRRVSLDSVSTGCAARARAIRRASRAIRPSSFAVSASRSPVAPTSTLPCPAAVTTVACRGRRPTSPSAFSTTVTIALDVREVLARRFGSSRPQLDVARLDHAAP